jgi:hypothetical protein
VLANITVGDVVTVMSGTEAALLNNENEGDSDAAVSTNWSGSVLWLFPVLMDMDGFFLDMSNSNGDHPSSITWSADTTNGIDGTWATYSTLTTPQATVPNYRSNIHAVAQAGVKALKFHNTSSGGSWRYFTVHLYGHPSAAGDRLEFWHPTLDQPLYDTPAFLDWAEVQRGTSTPPVKDVRLKNLASVLNAHDIVISHETLTDPSNHFKSAHSFSVDGGTTYLSTATIATIFAGAVSEIVKVKYAPLITDELSLRAGRLKTVTGSWS